MVHNHGTEDGPGLACPERRVDGKLVGACMAEPDYVFEAHLEGMDCGRRPCGTCAPAQRALSAVVAANAERRAVAGPAPWDAKADVMATLTAWLDGYTDPISGRQYIRTVRGPVTPHGTLELVYSPYDERHAPTRAYRVTVSIEEVQP